VAQIWLWLLLRFKTVLALLLQGTRRRDLHKLML